MLPYAVQCAQYSCNPSLQLEIHMEIHYLQFPPSRQRVKGQAVVSYTAFRCVPVSRDAVQHTCAYVPHQP